MSKSPKSVSLGVFAKRFPTEESAVKYFESLRWPGEKACPHCGSVSVVDVPSTKPMPYRCRDCRKHFSVRTGTVMQSSKIEVRTWLLAIYLMSVAKKGVSSCQMARQLGVRQATAWHVMHRIRESWNQGRFLMSGEVEADETYVGGKEKNKHASKKKKAGRGAVGKTAVVGFKERGGRVHAVVVKNTKTSTLHGIVNQCVAEGSNLYTDEHAGYRGMKHIEHQVVAHGNGQYAGGSACTNGIESFWALFKRGHYGTFHHLSVKHLPRYVDEFANRQNALMQTTQEQIAGTLVSMEGKTLPYKRLIAENPND